MEPLTAAAVLNRLRRDRLALWSAYAAVPLIWLAVALVTPVFLMLLPLVVGGLAVCFRYGPLDRFPVPDDPDF